MLAATSLHYTYCCELSQSRQRRNKDSFTAHGSRQNRAGIPAMCCQMLIHKLMSGANAGWACDNVQSSFTCTWHPVPPLSQCHSYLYAKKAYLSLIILLAPSLKVLKVHKSALIDNQITEEKNYWENNVGITWFSLARIPQMPQTTIT